MHENSIKNQSNFLVGREAQTDSTVHLGGAKKCHLKEKILDNI